jgi:hypothetical protein
MQTTSVNDKKIDFQQSTITNSSLYMRQDLLVVQWRPSGCISISIGGIYATSIHKNVGNNRSKFEANFVICQWRGGSQTNFEIQTFLGRIRLQGYFVTKSSSLSDPDPDPFCLCHAASTSSISEASLCIATKNSKIRA